MVVNTTLDFHRLMRAAVFDLFDEYKTSAGLKLAIYAGRPVSLFPPHAFCDFQNEDPLITTQGTRQRNLHSSWIIAWGDFDSKEAATQRDAFVDGFTAYVLTGFHKVGGATDLYVGTVADIPVFNPDWGSDLQRNTSYYATRITVEGFASG
jgi:hypothetical protein